MVACAVVGKIIVDDWREPGARSRAALVMR